jgi:GNAT superfamily N-acetyltransferase
MRYRRADAADVAVLAALNQGLLRDEGNRRRMTQAELEARMAGWLAGEYEAVLFEDDHGAAGYALFRREPEAVFLRQFFVEPDRRRRGVGRAAFRWLLAEPWADALRVRLEVLSGNRAAIAVWRAVGFSDYAVTMERPGAAGQKATPQAAFRGGT